MRAYSNITMEIPIKSRVHEALLRQDLPSFIGQSFSVVNPGVHYLHNWHINAIAEYLEACTRGEITRLIINVPPRALKSLCVSVAWPAWLLGHNPARRIIVASYSERLSLKHSQDCRLLMQSEWYKRIFPWVSFAKDQNEKAKFVTTERGFRFAASVGGTITGEGGNFLIVDDPHHPADVFSESRRQAVLQWFDQIFMSRADDKKRAVFVVVMQRLHENDLTGHLLAKESGWEHLCLPAIAEQKTTLSFGNFKKVRKAGELLHPNREGEAELKRAKQELGSYAYAAQYQQAPVPEEGGMIKPSWIKRYRAAPENPKRVVQSWDTAIKSREGNDYSVCTTWAESEEGYYLLEVNRLRMEYPDLKRFVKNNAEKYAPQAILIEDKASGQSLLQDLRRETKLPVIAILPHKDKITRMAAVSALIEAGKVFLPEIASWLSDYEMELLRFPVASFDDQVDATSQFLAWVQEKQKIFPQLRRI